MSTLSNYGGRRVIQFLDGGRRQTLSLGRMSERMARQVQSHVDELLAARAAAIAPSPAAAQWLGQIDDRLHSRLVRAGLAQPRVQVSAGLFEVYFRDYIRRRTDLKPMTMATLQQTLRHVEQKFSGRPMHSITPGEAADWQRELFAKYSPATVGIYIRICRQVFRDAVNHRLVADNPFAALRLPPHVNTQRQAYIPPEDVLRIMDYCTQQEWKLVFAMARFAGVRVPSELIDLKWSDISLETGRMIIHSPKTAHHPGRDSRTIPIFPQVEPILVDMMLTADRGEYVLRHLRTLCRNWSAQARRLCIRAGVKPWPRFWCNLRASCQTDLVSRFPLHVVCAWIGNTQPIAMKHYLRVTDEHFHMATSGAAPGAVDHVGQHRTGGEQQDMIPVENAEIRPSVHSDQESNKVHDPIEMLRHSDGALHRALQDLQATVEDLRCRDIELLSQQIRSCHGTLEKS